MSLNTEPALYTKLGFDPAYQSTFEDKIFIEGPQTARRLVTFFTLLLLATVIATYGVLSNSNPTVIGAMIVAPLMGPMMATTSAVVMGSLPRALRAFALTVAGIIAVILFSFLLSWIVPSFAISFTKRWRDYLAHQPRTLSTSHRVGGGRGWGLHHIPCRNRRRAGWCCNSHLARAPIVRCRDLSSSWSNECSPGLLAPLYDQLSCHSFRGRRGPGDYRPGKVGCLNGATAVPSSRLNSFRCMPSTRSHSPLANSISKHHRHRG